MYELPLQYWRNFTKKAGFWNFSVFLTHSDADIEIDTTIRKIVDGASIYITKYHKVQTIVEQVSI